MKHQNENSNSKPRLKLSNNKNLNHTATKIKEKGKKNIKPKQNQWLNPIQNKKNLIKKELNLADLIKT